MKIESITKYLALFMFMIVLSVSLVTVSAVAETRYVSDLLIISIREGQTDDSPVIGYLRSDTPVDVIEENDAYVNIKTPENLVGWVKKKFLVSEKPKAMRIEELKRRINDLEDKIILLQQNPETGAQADITVELESKIDALQEDINNQKQTASKLEDELRQANRKYNALVERQKQSPDMSREFQALKEKNQKLVVALEQAKQKPQPSFFSGNIKWFLTGAGVLMLGLIIGRSLRRKPRYRY